jgi:type IX secretion system PorP/SprF family membrane protein
MKKLFTKVVVALAGFSSVLMAQQDPQFTQFMHSKLIYNPGYAGTSNAICATLQYRQQWVNFQGAPQTGLLSFDMPVLSNLGVGINLMSDEIGAQKTFFARAAVAYNTNIGNKGGRLGIGIDGGMLQMKINNTWIAPEPGKDDASIPGYQATGSNVTNPNLSKVTYDLGFGAFFQIPNTMYIGLSSTHLPAQTIKGGGGDVKFNMARHYYLVAGYTKAINPRNDISANLKVKSDAATTQLDVNLTYEYNKFFWLGVSYRMEDAIAPMLGVRLLNSALKIGYSYDYTMSKIKGYTSGTHEIIIGYCMTKKTTKPTVYGNVRFLD